MTDQQLAQVQIERAPKEERTLIAGLMQRYLEEISPYTGQVAQGNGRFRYAELDLYWLKPEERMPYLIRLGRKTIGFALLRAVPGGTMVTEFYIAPAYRHQGYGRTAAHELFACYPGRWAVRQPMAQVDAQNFWRNVVGLVDSKYSERIQTTSDGRSWTVQRFTIEESTSDDGSFN